MMFLFEKCDVFLSALLGTLEPFWKIVVVVMHISPLVIGQCQMIITPRSAQFSLQWLLHAWMNSHLLKSLGQWSNVLWISLSSCPLNLLFFWSHWVEIIIVKRLVTRHNSMTWLRVEPRSCDQGRRKNDAFTLSASLLTRWVVALAKPG